jgi:N-acetylglucosaminyldiphosphoundecaprenol N-acetyl-beta-D-mannosaminyltransferase
MNQDRVSILGCEIDRLDMADTLEHCRAAIDGRRYTQHVAINAAKLVTLRQQPELREVVERCHLINADGQAIVWASRLLGDPLPERVAGVDLMQELLALAERAGYRVYILGAREEVLRTALATLHERHPKLVVAGAHHGYFAEDESPAVADEVRASRPDILFVAMSSPRKEQWLGRFGESLGVPLVMGVGGAIDIVAGVTRRAPELWQRLGVEWLYRLLQEPRRMFRRYLVTNAQFSVLLAREMAARAIAPEVLPPTPSATAPDTGMPRAPKPPHAGAPRAPQSPDAGAPRPPQPPDTGTAPPRRATRKPATRTARAKGTIATRPQPRDSRP